MVDVRDTLAHLRRLEAERRALGRARSERLRAHLSRSAQALKARGARRVVLFGSLAGTEPGPEADVDLAVEGLQAAAYMEALSEQMSLFGTRVDLVRLEEAPASLRDRIEAEGITL